METAKMNLLLAGIVISLLTTQAQIIPTIANTSGYKQSAEKATTPGDKSRELAKVQRKQRANEKRMIRRETKLVRRMEAVMLRMTGGFAYLSAP